MTSKLAILVLMVALIIPPGVAHADGAWLDAPTPSQWNSPRAAVPAPPPPPGTFDPRCVEQVRVPETAEDLEVSRAGWMLIAAYQAGWGIKVILGTSFFDGMCRPLAYQHFVFADGLFAGTVSPTPMDSRTDGSSSRVSLLTRDKLSATFERYAPSDALCCPSRLTSASFDIVRSSGWPVLTLTTVSTSSTGA